ADVGRRGGAGTRPLRVVRRRALPESHRCSAPVAPPAAALLDRLLLHAHHLPPSRAAGGAARRSLRLRERLSRPNPRTGLARPPKLAHRETRDHSRLGSCGSWGSCWRSGSPSRSRRLRTPLTLVAR